MARQTASEEIEAIVTQIQQSKKYRAAHICEETIRDVLAAEFRHRKKKDANRAARRKLHHIVASYLGEPDHPSALRELERAFRSNEPSMVEATCARIMMAHASTRERLVILNDFYARIFSTTGTPTALLDLACGLNPLSFRWMRLPTSTAYYAYDLNRQRVDFLNRCFAIQRLPEPARAQDVLIEFPLEKADVALILKEVHRFERRQRGCSLRLFDALCVRHLVVSFPTKNLTGRRKLGGIYTRLLHEMVRQRPWRISEMEFENELVFCIDKGPPM